MVPSFFNILENPDYNHDKIPLCGHQKQASDHEELPSSAGGNVNWFTLWKMVWHHLNPIEDMQILALPLVGLYPEMCAYTRTRMFFDSRICNFQFVPNWKQARCFFNSRMDKW